jgi:hypothetical protein
MPAAAPAEPVKPVARKVAPAVKVEAAEAPAPAKAASASEPKVSLREVVATAAANAARCGQVAEESALVTLENCLGEVYRVLPSALETGLVHDEYSAKLEALFEEL